MDAKFDRDIQNWPKIFGWGKQGSRNERSKYRPLDFNSRAFYAHVRLVVRVFLSQPSGEWHVISDKNLI